MQDAQAIYRIPPYTLGPEVYMAQQIEDIVDWGLLAHGIPDHWKETEGEGIVVGVADTGKPEHPDLKDTILESRNFSSSYTDVDQIGHGSHVCGIIAAARNDTGVIGVAPKAKLITAKVLGDDGSGDNAAVTQGIRWLTEQGCHIINLSLGGPFDAGITQAVKDAVDAGIFVICAAGNYGKIDGKNTISYPARLPYTVAVGSYNKAGRLSRFSSRGPQIHVAFPGENILSTWLDGKYRRISGTSMASPFASAVTALLLAKQNKPSSADAGEPVRLENNRDLIRLFQSSAEDKGPTGRDPGWGWGVVDVEKAMKLAAIPPEEESEPAQDIDLLFGMVRLRYPVELDGKTGAFIYIQ